MDGAHDMGGMQGFGPVVRDGAAVLDYLFATGGYVGRDATVLPRVILLDLKLPKLDGLEVLRRLRADPRTGLVPVVILTSSKQDDDVMRGYALGAKNVFILDGGFPAWKSEGHAVESGESKRPEAPERDAKDICSRDFV